MREIKFRGLTKKEGWVYGDLVHKKGIKYPIINFYTHDSFQCCYEVAPETVGQYTGLHDKNGREIYEGDIMQTSTLKAVVEIGKYTPKVLQDWADDELLRDDLGLYGVYAKGLKRGFEYFIPINGTGYEVIGNIHDNPELLKESEYNEKL